MGCHDGHGQSYIGISWLVWQVASHAGLTALLPTKLKTGGILGFKIIELHWQRIMPFNLLSTG